MKSCDVAKLLETPKASETEMKVCKQCNHELHLSYFTKRNSGTYRNECKSCRCEKEKQRREANQDMYEKKDHNYYSKNKAEILLKNKVYRDNNSQTIQAQKKQYYENNKQRISEYHKQSKDHRNAYLKTRSQNDPLFRTIRSLRAWIHDVLKNKKETKTNQLIGCNSKDLKLWIEFLFSKEMSWSNYGTYWHIDHVIPISFFDIENKDEQKTCFHWTNLRPLEARMNLQKSNKVCLQDIKSHYSTLKSFPRYQINSENCWWQRVELWYGNNLEDKTDCISLLKWAIRSQASQSANDKDMGKVQRLNDNGSEVFDHHH